MKTVKIVGGFNQPIAKIPVRDQMIVHPTTGVKINPELEKDFEELKKKGFVKRFSKH